ncbi:MAG: glycoside hydrolase family 3 C-terminal domain-containing protein, partial [Oscillospiraceae bacterium]
MLAINMEDVKSVLKLCAPYLIALGVVLVLALAVIVFCKKMPRAKKYLVRSQAILASVLAFVLVVNLICFGPMSTMLSLVTGKGVITEETSKEAEALVTEIANEGIVLLQNENLLPLDTGKPLNVFGWASTNPCYGGMGSGALSDSYPTVSLLEGLTNAGFSLNTALSDFYTAYRPDHPEMGMWFQDWTLPEPPASTYPTELLDGAKAFSDTAAIVITRVGGEGADLPTDMTYSDPTTAEYTNNSADYADFQPGEHYLQLSQSEKDMVDLVCKNFDNVVLIYNGSASFELGFTKDYPQIKSTIWCPGVGQNGFNSLGSILSGAVNPSGKTTDTFVADLTATPVYNNIGYFAYDNMEEFNVVNPEYTTLPTFVNYVEGIYVGYRFYETAAAEGLIDYDKTVVYPFGHGLSYTDFTQKMGPLQRSGDAISVDVTVTNTGAVAGKDVVQLYYNPPYVNGGIEKSAANLVAFDKTELLAPGASETVTLTFNEEDMASYDEKTAGCYVLEAGDYGISVRANSHDVIAEEVYTVEKTITYNESNPRSTDSAPAVNQFDDDAGNVTYLSRRDGFANYAEATAAPKTHTMPEEQKATFLNNSNYDTKNYDNAADVAPITGAKNGKTLAELRGLDYDDPAWEPLLDQLTTADMNSIISLGGYQTTAAQSVGKLSTIDCDGPASINNNFTGVGSIGFPAAVMIAATWSEDLAADFGDSIGKMADEMGVSGWYAPAMNNHRSAFAGRNFEYYSEDGFLSGKIAANAILGAEQHGVYAYMKHFALNDQETARSDMLCTWSNEQAIREIYLKPFELSVKEGGVKA